MDVNRLFSEIDEQELVNLTRQLIKIPSVYRPSTGGSEKEAAEFVARYLEDMGLAVLMEEVAPGRPNVMAVLDSGVPGRCLLFEGHTDVVTEGDPGAWTYHPFEAALVDGKIYGRGACDTKANLVAMILATKAIMKSKTLLKGKIKLCIPVDEEGMMTGIKHFIQQGHADDVDAAIICEPEENQLCITQKGAMRVVIRVFGKMAHGAMPLSGINPIPRMAKIAVAVQEMERREIETHGKDPFLGYPSITPTIFLAPVEGEPQINVVPAEAYMTLDIRTIPGQSHEQIEADLRKILDDLALADADFKATLEVIEQRPWTQTDKDEPIVRAMDKAYTMITGTAPRYNGVPGATDGTFLWAWKNIPIVTTGAGDRLIPHQKDEFVRVSELLETTKLYALAAALYLNEGSESNG